MENRIDKGFNVKKNKNTRDASLTLITLDDLHGNVSYNQL